MMKKLINGLLLVILFIGHKVNAQLPVWPHVTAATDHYSAKDNLANTNIQTYTPHQVVDWSGGNNPNVSAVPNTTPTSGQDNIGPTQAGFNECGNMVFYVMHTGTPANVNALEIWSPDGTLIMGTSTSPAAPNGNAGDDEVQVIKRPGFPNQWFLVYSEQSNDQYNCTRQLYSLIEINGTNANYVTLNGTLQQNLPLTAPPVGQNSNLSARLYIHGKAVSRTSVTAGTNGHDLYLHRRYEDGGARRVAFNNTTFSIDRFEITQNGIVWSANSGNIPSYGWGLLAAGSPIELSPTEDRLCVMARTDRSDKSRIYIFNLNNGLGNTLNSNYDDIRVIDLLIEPDVANSAITGYNATPGNFATYQTANALQSVSTYLQFFQNFERKISSAEFSPNGRYLYVTSGGYVKSGYGNVTYLAQIDLQNSFNGRFIARLQTQEIADINNGQQGWRNSDGRQVNSWSGWQNSLATQQNLYGFRGISRIQSSLNGNIYFTKHQSSQLFVIPNPDQPMPVDLTPGEVDLSIPGEPNINLQGFVNYMPDQIDGYNYFNNEFTQVSVLVENYINDLENCERVCNPINFAVVEAGTNNVLETFTDIECLAQKLCVKSDESYDIVAYDNVNNRRISNAIVNGVVNYPNGATSFDVSFEAPFETVSFPFEYKIADNCAFICAGETIDITVTGISYISGRPEGSRQITIDPCGETEICLDPGFYYTAEYNDVSHVIYENGNVQLNGNEAFVFTTDDLSASCCPIQNGIDINDEDVTSFFQNITITQNTTWDNKVYIDDNVIVTVANGAILDVTTTDIIFGVCAGIDFANGGTLRASNTVFRPCDMNSTWRGLKFLASQTGNEIGIINECTFKNATRAVDISSTTAPNSVASEVRFTNNLFSNCQVGISLNYISLNKGITGNTFQVDDDEPGFINTCTSLGQYAGIYSNYCDFNAEVSQNDFISSTDNNRFLGLRIFYSDAGSFSQNNFTNNFNAIILGFSQNIALEDNEITVTELNMINQNQFFFGFNNDVKVIGNRFYNSDENNRLNAPNNNSNYSAIGMVRANTTNIKQNEFIGFENGVQANSITNSNISENTFKDCWHYGVYLQNPTNTDIACNVINMEYVPTGETYGIGVYHTSPSILAQQDWNQIRGNCIYETTIAIDVQDNSWSWGSTAPEITNNFLYNYTVAGINLFEVNAAWALGTGLTQTTASKNTFVSNNILNGAADIVASQQVNTAVWGSSGISRINGNVQLIGNNLFNSTASCSNQIGTVNAGIDTDEVCDRLSGNEYLYEVPTPEGSEAIFATKIELVDPEMPVLDNVKNIDENSIRVFPVPATDEVTVTVNTGGPNKSIIQIFDLGGKLVHTVSNLGQFTEVSIDVSSLNSGAYILQVSDELQVIGKTKLIITK